MDELHVDVERVIREGSGATQAQDDAVAQAVAAEREAWRLKDEEASRHYGKEIYVYYGKEDFQEGVDPCDFIAGIEALTTPSPQAAQQAPAGATADAFDAMAIARYKVVPSDASMFHRFAVVAGDGKQQLYLGREVECQNMAQKFMGAFLDGAFAYRQLAAPAAPSTPASGGHNKERNMNDAEYIAAIAEFYKDGPAPEFRAHYERLMHISAAIAATPSQLVAWPASQTQEDAKDAARYRWLREGNDAKHGAAWHVAVNLYGCEWDAAIDAAIAAQQGDKT